MSRLLYIPFIFLLFSLFPSLCYSSPPPEAFGQLKRVYDGSISPDGKLIALIENADSKYSVRITDLEGNTKYRDLVGLHHSVKPLWVKWANNERVLVGVRLNILLQDVPAGFTYIYSQSVHEDKGSILVNSLGTKRQFNANVLNFLMDDPAYILMGVDSKVTRTPEVRKVNVSSGKFIRVQAADKNIGEWIVDRQGNVRISIGVKAKKGSGLNIRIREFGSEVWRNISDFPGLNAQERIFGFSENPNEVLFAQYNGKNTLGLYGYDLKQKKVSRELFHHDVYDIERPVFSGDGTRLIGVRFQSETHETIFLDDIDAARGKSRTPSGSKKLYRFLDQSKDGQKIIYEVSASDDSGSIVLYDTVSAHVTEIGVQYPELENQALGKVISVNYKARDGFEIPAYITLPPGLSSREQVQNLPFIILPHGGPYARVSDRFDYFSQFFATKGFAVLQMNFRGSTGYGKKFEESGRKNWELMLEDVEDGARWLAEENMSNPDQTCIAGWSFGGYAALMGAVRNADLYKCAISIAGVTDLNDLANDQKKYVGGTQRRNSITAGFDGYKDMRRMSPVEEAKNIRIPVFMAHGTHDQRVHFDQFKRMEKKIKKSGVPYVAKEYIGDDHFISIEVNRKDMFHEIDKFLYKSVGEIK